MISTGIYTWQYAGGAFPVTLRPNGVFHCGQFPALASWSAEEQGGIAKRLHVDWKNFGKYEFSIAPDGSCLEGFAVGNPSNWRKMTYSRPLNDAEKLLMAGEGGSVWDFQWEKGSFEVEFRCDGYNHFVCASFPEHSHWQMDDGNKLMINWGKYGEYEMIFDPATQTMSGHKVGQPSNWRKAKFLRPLGPDALTSGPAHDHSHSHDEHCGHH